MIASGMLRFFANSLFGCAGPVPEALGDLSVLKDLQLQKNKLTGERHGLLLFWFDL